MAAKITLPPLQGSSTDSFDDSNDDFDPSKQIFSVANEKTKNSQRGIFNMRKNRHDIYCTEEEEMENDDGTTSNLSVIPGGVSRLTPECSTYSPIPSSVGMSPTGKEITQIPTTAVVKFENLPSTVEINNQKIFSNNTLKMLQNIKKRRIASVEPKKAETPSNLPTAANTIPENSCASVPESDTDDISIISGKSITYLDSSNKLNFFKTPINRNKSRGSLSFDKDLQLLYCP